jgi:hypothetical protein
MNNPRVLNVSSLVKGPGPGGVSPCSLIGGRRGNAERVPPRAITAMGPAVPAIGVTVGKARTFGTLQRTALATSQSRALGGTGRSGRDQYGRWPVPLREVPFDLPLGSAWCPIAWTDSEWRALEAIRITLINSQLMEVFAGKSCDAVARILAGGPTTDGGAIVPVDNLEWAYAQMFNVWMNRVIAGASTIAEREATTSAHVKISGGGYERVWPQLLAPTYGVRSISCRPAGGGTSTRQGNIPGQLPFARCLFVWEPSNASRIGPQRHRGPRVAESPSWTPENCHYSCHNSCRNRIDYWVCYDACYTSCRNPFFVPPQP